MGHYFSFIWADMWPNIFAPGFWTVMGIVISHYRLKGHVNRKHDELHGHIDTMHQDLHRKITQKDQS